MRYSATSTGISLGASTEVSWQDLEDALASFFHPGSSASALRADLEAALREGVVDGKTDRLRAVLDTTDPRQAMKEAATVHPSEVDPEGWARAYNQVTRK